MIRQHSHVQCKRAGGFLCGSWRVPDGSVVRMSISGTWNVLFTYKGYGFEPWSGWTWGALSFCLRHEPQIEWTLCMFVQIYIEKHSIKRCIVVLQLCMHLGLIHSVNNFNFDPALLKQTPPSEIRGPSQLSPTHPSPVYTLQLVAQLSTCCSKRGRWPLTCYPWRLWPVIPAPLLKVMIPCGRG